MKEKDLIKIKALATNFRSAIEKCDKSVLITFENFPRGSCGDACLLLAKYLQNNGCGVFNYICGVIYGPEEYDEQSHAWLERDDVIVDITADQFPDINESVIVTTDHAWYNAFQIKINHTADFENYDKNTASTLSSAYRKIILYLDAV
jgi:hypothetical protein